VLQSGEAMVEAAHIHPFCEAGDDDPPSSTPKPWKSCSGRGDFNKIKNLGRSSFGFV
jgi:hypothetical protein